MRYLPQLIAGFALVAFGIALHPSGVATAMPNWPARLALIGGGALLGIGLAHLFGEGDRVEVEMEYRDRLQDAGRRLEDAERKAAELSTALAARERQAARLIAEIGALQARFGVAGERASG